MTDKHATFKDGFKYQLVESYTCATPLRFAADIDTPYVRLDRDGTLTCARGYAWDGASGPTFDTENTITPSLVHDALYQLIREGLLPDTYRDIADQLFYDNLRARGMAWLRAKAYYVGVRFGGGAAVRTMKTVRVAP